MRIIRVAEKMVQNVMGIGYILLIGNKIECILDFRRSGVALATFEQALEVVYGFRVLIQVGQMKYISDVSGTI